MPVKHMKTLFGILIAVLAFLPAKSHAQIVGTQNQSTFTCTGILGPYPFTWPAYDPPGIQVFEQNTATGAATNLSLTTDYTVTPVNLSYINGGTVTLVAPCASGNSLTILRNTEQTQLNIFTEYMPSLYQTFQSTVDKLTMEIQDESSRPRVTSIVPGQNISCTPDIYGSCTGQVVINSTGSSTGGSGFNPAAFNAKCDGVTDDTAALQAMFTAAYAVVQAAIQANPTNNYTQGPVISGSGTGSQCMFSNTLTIAQSLSINNLSLGELPAIGSNTGLNIFHSLGPQGGLYNSTVLGCGAACVGSVSGSLIQFKQTVGYSLFGNTIGECGGHCLNVINSERMTVDGSNLIEVGAQLVNVFGPSNESRWSAKLLNNGVVDTTVGPAYVWSPNAPGGVFPGPNQGSGGTPTRLIPYMDTAAFIVDGADDFHIDGAGSIKGSRDSPMLWVQHSFVTANNLYVEQSHSSTGTIVGGPSIYTSTTAAMNTVQTNVAVANQSYNYTVTNLQVAPGLTSLLQHYWIDSCTDAASLGQLGNFVIYPPDYIANSTAVSQIDTGSGTILKGMYEVAGGAGYCGVAAPSLQLATRGAAGGCSAPAGVSALGSAACTAHAAIAWPAGAVTAEQVGGGLSVLDTPGSHLEGYDGPVAGYTIAADNTGPLTAAEISVGNIPDPYQVPQGCATSGSVLMLHNNVLFNDGTPGFTAYPGIGLIQAHTCATIDVSGETAGQIPQVTFDTTNASVYLNPFFAYGPSAIVGAVYPNGQSAVVTIRDADGERTVSSGDNVQTQLIAPADPTTGITMPGQSCAPGCSLYTKPPVPVTPAVTVNTSGGTIALGPYGQLPAVSIAYVLSTAYPPGGFSGGYPNATITSGGSGYNTVTYPQVSVGDINPGNANTATITTIQSNGTIVGLCTSAAIPSSYAVGTMITLSGMRLTATGVSMNAKTYTISSIAAPSGCTNGFSVPNTASTIASTTEVGAATISACPYWFMLASSPAGTVTSIGNTSAGDPGYCKVPPGTTVNLAFSDGVVSGSHAVATGTLVVQGSYQTPSQPYVVPALTGVSNSLTVASPPAQPNSGLAASYNVYAGPLGYQYFVANTLIGNPTTIGAITYTPTAAGGQLFMPKDCAAYCTWDTQVQLTNNHFFGRTYNYLTSLANANFFDFTPSAITFSAPVFLLNLPDGCVQVVSGQLTSRGVSCGTGGSGVPSVNSISSAVTIAAGTGIGVSTAGGTVTISDSGTGTAANISGGTPGAVPYQTGTGATAFLAPNTTATQKVMTETSSVPAWANATGAALGTANAFTGANTFSGGFATSAIPVAYGRYYGADPTGATDSTTAINNCLTTTGSGVLRNCYLDAGTYHVTNSLLLGTSTGQCLIGDGFNTIIDVSTDFSTSANGVIVTPTGTNANVQPCIKDIAINFHQTPDSVTTTTAASSTGATTITVASVPSTLAVGDFVIDVTSFSAISSPFNSGFTTVTNISGNVLTLSIATTGNVGNGDSIQFNKPRSGCTALGTANLTPGSGCVKYPWAIYNNGAQTVRLDHVMIEGAWDGYYQRGQTYYLDGLYIGALDQGINQDLSSNFSMFQSYLFWNFGFGQGSSSMVGAIRALTGVYFDGTTVAANLGRNDGVAIGSIQSFGGNLNFTSAWTYGSIDNIEADGNNANVTFNGTSSGYTNIATMYRIGALTTQSPIQVQNGRVSISNLRASSTVVSAYPEISVTGGEFHVGSGLLYPEAGTQGAVASGGRMDLNDMQFTYLGSCTANANGFIQATSGIFIQLKNDVFTNTTCPQVGINIATDNVQQDIDNVVMQQWTFTPPGTLGHYTTISPVDTDFYNVSTFHANLVSNGIIPLSFYSAAGTPLPTCNSTRQGMMLTVSDATAPTYLGAYTSGGTITAPVVCGYNGTTYAWQTH